ncbi:TetR/AcrR family transcriptional regulator [Pseudochryseolinea flava]|uniref:TetR/AcrR family transcriptional regulator n=1 Tax=Pseudochryseolinea flava TaxID=2059302 RepID=A0A364XXN4_9BACT|nr:TetR/AcrR family transcriptional regulator [Pseudochryseolinea flava]RAV99208.1 TetR/AcrR family transcriptional regulator [Pseudochryseolinea flava]
MKAARTRQFIIEKTAPLFNTKGFDGTSLSDMEQATKLTKGSIYGNFRDKEEIASEAFKFSMEKVRELARSKVDAAITNKEQLVALLGFYASYVFDPPIKGGCPLLNTAIEADDHRKGMRRVVVKELTNTIDFIAGLLTKGIKAKEFKRDVDARSLAYTFFCAVEGAVIFSRVERSREPMDIVVAHCKDVLDKIST